MSNGDDAMTSAEFAKLMGAYPEPAGNPLPTYGGYMDNSAANFSWVQNNDYFGADSDDKDMVGHCGVCSSSQSYHPDNMLLIEDYPELSHDFCKSCKSHHPDYEATAECDYFKPRNPDVYSRQTWFCQGCGSGTEFLIDANKWVADAESFDEDKYIPRKRECEKGCKGVCNVCWDGERLDDYDDYGAESCTCNDMFGSLCPQCNYDSDREGGVCPNGCTVDLAGSVRPQEMQIYTECRIHGQKLGAESFQSEYEVVHLKGGHLVAKFIHIDCPMSKEIDGWDVEDGEIQFFDPDDYPTGVCATCGKSITLSDKDNAWVQTWYEDEETFEAFNIGYDDTTNQIHIENKCDGCGKEFLFTDNGSEILTIAGGRAGVIVYENLGNGEIYEPTYSPYGDLLCKACWKINKEEDENADSRGQGQYGAEREDTLIKGFYCNSTEACRDTETVVRWRREDKTAKCLECDYVWKMQTIDEIREFEEMEDSFNAEGMSHNNVWREVHRSPTSMGHRIFQCKHCSAMKTTKRNIPTICEFCGEGQKDGWDAESFNAETIGQFILEGEGKCQSMETGKFGNHNWMGGPIDENYLENNYETAYGKFGIYCNDCGQEAHVPFDMGAKKFIDLCQMNNIELSAEMDIGKSTPLADFTDEELEDLLRRNEAWWLKDYNEYMEDPQPDGEDPNSLWTPTLEEFKKERSIQTHGRKYYEIIQKFEQDLKDRRDGDLYGEITPNENWKEIANGDYREWMDTVDGAYDETYFVDMKKMKIYLVKFFFDVKGSIEACNWAKENLGIECDGMNDTSKTFNYDPVNPQGHVSWVGFEKVYASKQKKKEIPIYDAPYTHMEITESDKKFKMAEMDIVADGMAVVSNIRDEVVGVVEVIDDEDDDEMVEISIQDENMDEIGSYTLDDGMILDDEDNYLAEHKTPSLLTLGIGAIAAIFAFPYLKEGVSKVFSADNDIQENEPELIENPDIGDLDPAQYEELVVESTGLAIDIIPMGLDGSFMGSRFAALPTERYVDYNDPGIGAHTDVALNRDENFLEPEMAMVQASEDIKEAQAPGQSPYLSVDGQEPKDFNYRVIKETHPISLDPAVKPFIPQSMTGYTGNKNTPPSVYNKMFNIGVLGQTPLFTPQDAGDIGASHAGSRRATPNTLGLNGSVGGPLSDKVNANYTDGQTSMSLAQWAIENTVSQSSDTEAVVIDRSSGAMKRVRRV